MGETFEIVDSEREWEGREQSKFMLTGKMISEERVLEAFRRICGNGSDP